jgi:hypothetical protein
MTIPGSADFRDIDSRSANEHVGTHLGHRPEQAPTDAG